MNPISCRLHSTEQHYFTFDTESYTMEQIAWVERKRNTDQTVSIPAAPLRFGCQVNHSHLDDNQQYWAYLHLHSPLNRNMLPAFLFTNLCFDSSLVDNIKGRHESVSGLVRTIVQISRRLYNTLLQVINANKKVNCLIIIHCLRCFNKIIWLFMNISLPGSIKFYLNPSRAGNWKIGCMLMCPWSRYSKWPNMER